MKMLSSPVLNTGKIQNANRAAMFPKAREFGNQMSKKFNMDQPRAQKYYTDRLFDFEAGQLPGLMERNQQLTSGRDTDIRSLIARLRAQQAQG